MPGPSLVEPGSPCCPGRAGVTPGSLHLRRGCRPMTARTHRAQGLRVLLLLAASLPPLSGCHGLLDRHEASKIPQYGVIDPNQPRELQMVSLPPYVIEPPDELEVSMRPAVPDLNRAGLTVPADGLIDLGVAG